MSQLLRLVGRIGVSSVRNKENHSVCMSCLILRTGMKDFSTQTKTMPYTKLLKRKKWKGKKQKETIENTEEHQQLIEVIDARVSQLSSSGSAKQPVLETPSQYHRLSKDNLRLAHNSRNNKTHKQNEHSVAVESDITQSGNQTGLHISTDSKERPVEVGNQSGLEDISAQSRVTLNDEALSRHNSDNIDSYNINPENSLKNRDEVYGAKQNSVIKESEQNDTKFSDTENKMQKKTILSHGDKSQQKTEKLEQKHTHKKKRLKAALKEVYGRKNKKIHKQKEELNNGNKHGVKEMQTLLAALHSRSSFGIQATLANGNVGINEAKQLFSYKPEDVESDQHNQNHLLEVLFEKDTKDLTEDDLHAEQSIASENMEEKKGLEATKIDADSEKGRVPDAEWAVLKAISKKKGDVSVLSVAEMDKRESIMDVFHEDTSFSDNLAADYSVSEWAEDFQSIEGYITKKAQKKHKEKRKKQMVQELKCGEEMLLYSKQEIFNQDLLSYVEACICCGITTRAFQDVKMYREKKSSVFTVKDIRIYNQILRGLGREEKGLNLVRQVFSYIREDGLQPNYETYMLCLSCVSSIQEPEYKSMLASFIIRDMMNEGLEVKDIFNQCTFLFNERSSVYQLLTELIPDYEPNPPNVSVDYSGPLVEPLNEMLPVNEKVEVNPFTCGLTKEELMKAAEEEFSNELEGFVNLNSIFRKNKQAKKQMAALEEVQEHWKEDIRKAFAQQKAELLLKAYKTQGINMYPYFNLFPDVDYVDILCKELNWWLTFSQMFSPSAYSLKCGVVERIRQRFCIQQMIDVDVFPKLHKAYSEYVGRLSDPNTPIQSQRQLWAQIMQRVTDGNSMDRPVVEWSETVKNLLGHILFDILNSATFDCNILNNKPKKIVKVFYVVERHQSGKRRLELKPHPMLSDLINAQTDLIFPTSKMPSLCPPVPIMGPGQGGNFTSTIELIRWSPDQQLELFKEKVDEVGPVLDSLNVLSTYAWTVNKPVLDVILKVFKEGGNEDLEIPILPENVPKPQKHDYSEDDIALYNKNLAEYRKQFKEATSLWWTGLYKLSIANKLRDRTFWLVVNMDFRGRTYPVAPHLHHQNQDYVKALMLFAKGKPLGENGFRWLKLHLVNLTEHKKKSSLEERMVYAEEVMPEILDSAKNPLTGRKWWMASENPWQTLAACKEVAAALQSGDPATYVSHYPVHQDGSCNGLQHYAAMGRDVTGAKSVNLKSEGPNPADVYSDVVDLVKIEIEKDIRSESQYAEIAKLCQPYLERKVIKQSIMTTVYGVTMYGARLQIKRQLGYKDFPDEHIIAASTYLAVKTFKCLNNLFTSARKIQNWFDQCSFAISKTNNPVEWKTPLNFVCIQPYFKELAPSPDISPQVYQYLCTKTDIFRLSHVNKQKNGFAPNFVHSLDSVHMMLTSLYCYRKGLTYGSVHDSYWTHASDVEIMSRITREQFIALHSQPILQDLSRYFIDRYINREDLSTKESAKLMNIFTSVPEKGKFDLKMILDSPYFFS